MQMKIPRDNHFTLNGITMIKKTVVNIVKNVEKLETPSMADKNVKWYSHFEKQLAFLQSV